MRLLLETQRGRRKMDVKMTRHFMLLRVLHSQVGKPVLAHYTYSIHGYIHCSALLWSRRRERLDRQEADLLKRVQGVREKVVGHMTKQQRSHDKRNH